MKQQSGFTLIELVIVIIILGILAATAVPKFVDLQGDARASALKGVKAALEGGATLTYSQAAIEGKEKSSAANATTKSGVPIIYGYPKATETAIRAAVDLSANDWSITGTAPLIITASGSSATNCQVEYTESTGPSSRPVIEAKVDGC